MTVGSRYDVVISMGDCICALHMGNLAAGRRFNVFVPPVVSLGKAYIIPGCAWKVGK